MLRDREGIYWFGTQGGGISLYQEDLVRFDETDGLPGTELDGRPVYHPKLGILFSDRSGNLVSFDGRHFTTTRFDVGARIVGIAP